MCAAERHTGRAALAAQLVVLLACLGFTSGTHFRYGSMRWWVGPDSLNNVRDVNGRPVYQAVFEVKGAWRRDYSWGALFNEAWRPSASMADGVWYQADQADGDHDCSETPFSNPKIQCFEGGNDLLQSAEEFTNYQIRFVTGLGFGGYALPASGQCTSPNHKGMFGDWNFGTYGGPGPSVLPPGNYDTTNVASYYWGEVTSANVEFAVKDDNALDEEWGNQISAKNVSESGVCGPWSETYGFFFGDGEHADELVVTVTDIDFERGLVGNSIRATSTQFTHTYPNPFNSPQNVLNAGRPWVAYWTGGNRLSELRNNADGRFRLEIDVRFLTSGSGDSMRVIDNRSPIVTQIPVMPIAYPTTGTTVRFQVAAYDPDYGDRKDQVRFFVGTPQEHGYVLANYVRYREEEGAEVQEIPTYFQDVYHRTICEKNVAAAGICTDAGLVGPATAGYYLGQSWEAGQGNLTAEGLNTSALYAAWDDSENIAKAPINLDNTTIRIGALNGMVEWEVGTGPFDGLEPGFYQVTIMVEERIESSFLDTMGTIEQAFRTRYDQTNEDMFQGYALATGNDRLVDNGGSYYTQSATRNGGPKVPVDFMMYLYPAMHYCSSNCDRSGSVNFMQTFESADGLYGDPEGIPRPGDGLEGGGTGTCKICGGGGAYTNVLGDSGMEYFNVTKDSLSYCSVMNVATSAAVQSAYARGYENEDGVAEYGLWRSTLMSDAAWKDYSDKCTTGAASTTSYIAGKTCLEDELNGGAACDRNWVFQGCLGISWTGAASIVPYDGILNTCQINNPPRFITECDCAGHWQTTTGSPAIFTPSAQGCLYNMRAGGGGIEQASSRDGTSCCAQTTTPELTSDPENALYEGMFKTGTIRGILGEDLFFELVATDDDQCTELVISDTGLPSQYMTLEPHRRIGPRTVARRFTFNPPDNDNITATNDPREQFSRVCFYVTDKYLLTSYPFHCLNIELVPPVATKWCDEDASNGNAAPGTDSSTNTLEPFKVMRSYSGETITLPLCVYKSETANVEHNMQILTVEEESPSIFPSPYEFSYPLDQINFPPFAGGPQQRSANIVGAGWYFDETPGTDSTTIDPLWRTFTFTPDETQECVYTVCFRGVDVDSADLVTPTNTPSQYTSVRCYRIEVYNSVLEFNGESEVAVASLSEQIYIQDGFSMSVWAYPSCVSAGTNMTLMYFGSTRHFQTQQGYYGGDKGLPIRNGLKWAQTADAHGRFYYEDWRVGIKASDEMYACDMWHYVAFTVNETHDAVFYVDGSEKVAPTPESLHTVLSTQYAFKTPSRPDTPDDISTGTGRFAVGSYNGEQTLVGMLDDIYVWNRALSADEVGRVMKSRTLESSPDLQEALLVWFPMRDGNGGDSSWPLPDYSGSGFGFQLSITSDVAPTVVDAATPAVTPCVRGLEMPVGPTDGTCVQAVYGWNFARSPWNSVKFGDIKVPASFVDSSEMMAETPGYQSPRFVSVTASNNGEDFTDVSGSGRDTTFLYLDAGLYMDGAGGGASADQVCLDLKDRAVTFGAWVCVDCGQPEVHYNVPNPGMPNPMPQPEPTAVSDHVLKPLVDMGMMEETRRTS